MLHDHLSLAAAGGGSGGFGGGGGGGGGFHGGGGRGIALYFIFRALLDLLIWGHGVGALIVIGLIVAFVLFNKLGPAAERFYQRERETGRSARRRVASRERRVELAAAEAAELQDAFAPENVRTEAGILFEAIQRAWDQDDRAGLRRLVAPSLLAEWERRLDDFDRRGWRNRVSIVEWPRVEYVGLTQTRAEIGDRVVVRIEARVRDYVIDAAGNRIKRAGSISETVRVREFWTLQRRGKRWILGSVEQGAEGAHALAEEIVATPWSDERALRDEALVEGAVAEAVPDGAQIAELASIGFTGEARAAALDLSLADGRFAPDVLEVAARRAVAAWADAVDGDDSRLRSIARPDAARDLLHPGDPSGKTRLVVRGLKVRQIQIEALDAAATPPTMTIDLELSGKRYVEDRDTTAVLAGNKYSESRFTERWLLALDGSQAQPWQLAAVLAPLAAA